MPFVLELQEYHLEYDTFIHCGYVNSIFTNKEEASEYLEKYKSQYCKHSKLSNLNGWKSTVLNNFRYVVREYYNEKCTINPFS